MQIRYTGYRDRPQEERQIRFQTGCREGHTEISFVASGTNLQLVFNANHGPYLPERECDFDKEHGKVRHIQSWASSFRHQLSPLITHLVIIRQAFLDWSGFNWYAHLGFLFDDTLICWIFVENWIREILWRGKIDWFQALD